MGFYPVPIKYNRFEEDFPGWATLTRTVTEKILTLKGIQNCVGVTKQQIDYWMQKGVLSTADNAGTKWRRFSVLDILLIAIAAKFKSHGIEISEIANVNNLLPIWSEDKNWTDCFVYIINGYDVYLVSDFTRFASTISIDPEDIKGNVGLLRLNVRTKSGFLAAVSLKKVCDDLAPKLQIPNFKVKVLKNGSYEFVINGVPLKLESLERDGTLNFLDELCE